MEISYRGAMTDLKNIVIERLTQLGLGPVEAAVQGGLERTYIVDIVDGRKKSVRSDKLAGLARALKLDAQALARGEALPESDNVVPLPTSELTLSNAKMAIGRVAGTVEAGAFREVDEFDQSEPVEIALPRDELFPNARQLVFDVAGDSMNDLRPLPIFPGSRLVGIAYEDVEHLVELKSGMVVVVQRERDGGHFREWSVKQLELFTDRAEFHPRSTNPKHKPIVIRRDHDADDGVTVQVIALVRRVMNEMPGF